MPFLSNFALWFLIFVTLGRFQELFPFFTPFRLGIVSSAFALAVVLATNTKDLTLFLKSTPISKYFIIILVIAFLGIPFSVYKGPALEEYIDYLRTILTTSLIVGLGRRNMQSLLLSIICVLLLISVQMLLNQVVGRISVSSTYDPNDIGLLCVTYLPFALYGISSKNKIVKIISLIAAGGGVASVALSGSRGGLIALALVALYCIVLAKKRRMLLIALCCIGATIFMAMAGEELWLRLQALRDGTDYNFTAGNAGRMSIWLDGVSVGLRRPILGVGIGQFIIGIGTLADGPWKAPHNTFLQIFVELGVVGLYAFCAIFYSLYCLSIAGAKAKFLSENEQILYMYLRVSILAFCSDAFLLSHAYSPIAYTLFAVASVMYLNIKNKEERAQEEMMQVAQENKEPQENKEQDTQQALVKSVRRKSKHSDLHKPAKALSSQAHNNRASKQKRLEAGDSLFRNK